MGRWDISDPARQPASPAAPSAQEDRQEAVEPSLGRGGSATDTSAKALEREAPNIAERDQAGIPRRSKYEVRDQTYSLRPSELKAMADIGRLRAIDVRDLARFVYAGSETRMRSDLEHLRKQGLIEERDIYRAHQPARKLVTLTATGVQVTRQTGGLPREQRLYHGIVKPRELHHDADLYKVYQKAAAEIRRKGGEPLRVHLDFEFKESINRAKESARALPKDMRERWLAALASEHGLSVEGGRIHLPDVQIEYQTREGKIERENLELLSRNYREQGIRGKAAAGFKIYARVGDSGRVRRALRDTGFVREVLAI